MNDKITDLAQKLFNEAGGQGNLYRMSRGTVQFYENKAIKKVENTRAEWLGFSDNLINAVEQATISGMKTNTNKEEEDAARRLCA